MSAERVTKRMGGNVPTGRGLTVLLTVALAACATTSTPRTVHRVPITAIPGHASLRHDDSPKQPERLLPPETYIRTYLQLFGGLAPSEVQERARGRGNLFDTWDDYLAALGLPDYQRDIPRAAQSNALMVAAFERLGIALCDRAVEHDLRGPNAPPVAQRIVFRFELPPGEPDEAAFVQRFDVLHRLFLGYPVALATTDRNARFFRLYRTVAERHTVGGGVRGATFAPSEAGWAAVCYGLIRHPEFHLY
jgi:hypothetical protein